METKKIRDGIANLKIARYGEQAVRYRRGLINHTEFMNELDVIEKYCLELGANLDNIETSFNSLLFSIAF